MKTPARIQLLALAAAVWAVFPHAAVAEEFKFDAGDFERKRFEYSGYLEQKEELLGLRSDSPAYRLAWPGAGERESLLRNTSTLELAAKLNLDQLVGDVRAQASYASDALAYKTNYGKVMEGGFRWSADPTLTFDVGKRVQRWGKGYAWNPVGFVERPKDANDPLSSREGFVMASAEWTRSMSGPLSTLTATALLVPTNDDINTDFGKSEDLNPAAKLYLLAFDTDIDLMWRGEGARAQSFGFDFSRNIGSALEVHGEFARTLDAQRNTVSASGVSSSRRINFNSALLGLRVLTSNEVTWIAEYYHNGAGYSANELDDYYRFLDTALAPGAAPSLAAKARNAAQSGYARSSSGRDYAYLKASVSEPFDWLYTNVALTTMVNLNDSSFQVTPEISYTGFSNLELRARLILFGGQSRSEFAEKTASKRLEAYARYSF